MGLISGIRATILPAKGAGTNQTLRVDDYGNVFAMQGLPASLTAALEGSLFVARATPAAGGTGVASAITTAFVDTTPCLVLSNGEAAGSGKRYMPMYIRGRITAAGASTTSSEISVQVDNTNRYSSGGTSLTSTINNANADAGVPASLATLNVGAVTAAAAGARRRQVGSALLKVAAAPLFLVNDVILITFGAPAQFVHQSQVVASDAAAPVVTAHVPMPACVIPAAGSLALFMANVANAVTPPSIEWEMAWIER